MATTQETGDDPFPSLNEAFVRRVQAGLDKRLGDNAPQIDWDDWVRLKRSLAAYKREAEDFRGYLNKGEVKLLRDVSTRAKAVLLAVQRAEGKGLSAPIASSLEPNSIGEFQVLLGRVVEELSLKGKTTADFPDVSRVNFFASFEAWWKRTTGLPAEIVEGFAGNTHPTPFMWVANEIFNMPGVPVTIGASSKPLKDLKRSDSKRFETEKTLAEKLKKAGRLK